MGNINDGSFRTIWNSPVYEEFRYNAKILPKSDPYFAPIGCYKMCDNIGQLATIERNMQRLRPAEKLVPIVLPAFTTTEALRALDRAPLRGQRRVRGKNLSSKNRVRHAPEK